MTLRALGVSNFKCFLDLRLELAPLTLLTGFNAAGKSTALQSILLISQGLRASHASQSLPLNGPLVRLGSVGDVLSNSGTADLSNRTSGREIAICLASAGEEITWRFNPLKPKTGALDVREVTYRKDNEPSRSWTGHLRRSEGPPALSDLIDALQATVFISAVRGGPADAFPVPDDVGLTYADVGTEGQYAPWWYDLAADDEIDQSRRHPDEPAKNLRRQIDAYLGELFPGAQATADKIERTSLVRLGLRTKTTSDWRRPANIGYGLTYSFPVLVALLLAKNGQTIIIDSPEAHLHPRSQSKMGEILARVAASGVQLLVETHSDHVLNGVRLAIKRKFLKPSHLLMHFFGGTSDEGVHGIVSPRIDSEGTIEAWPTGFFDQAEGDLAALVGWE